MKNNFILSCLFVFTLIFTSCDTEDFNGTFDVDNGQVGINFVGNVFSLPIPEEGLTLSVPVEINTVSSSDRSFATEIDPSSVGDDSEYSIGAITIPANSFIGSIDITFNFTPIPEGAINNLIINLLEPEGGVIFQGGSASSTLDITYFREIICNDVEVLIVTDFWADETTWEITDFGGAVVASGGPYAQIEGAEYLTMHNLPDGDYTFTIFDAFGDGQVNGAFIGSYLVTCDILIHATGEGALAGGGGSFESTNFSVNP